MSRKVLRQTLLLDQKEGFIGNVDAFCRRFSDIYFVAIHLFDSRGKEHVVMATGKEMASMYIQQTDEGRFQLLQMKKRGHLLPLEETLFNLWNHPEPGKAVNIAPLTPPSAPGYHVHSVTIDGNGSLYSIIPHGDKLWRHVLIEPQQVLYVFADSRLVSTQVYHGKTNPYFYIDGEATISVLICSLGEKAAHALLCESRTLFVSSERIPI